MLNRIYGNGVMKCLLVEFMYDGRLIRNVLLNGAHVRNVPLLNPLSFIGDVMLDWLVVQCFVCVAKYILILSFSVYVTVCDFDASSTLLGFTP